MTRSMVVCTPERRCDPSLAIAAVRAGATGLLDLGFHVSTATRREAVARLARLCGDRPTWGLRWDTWGAPDRTPEALAGLAAGRVPILLLAGLDEAPDEALRDALEQARALADLVWLESISPEAAERAQAAGADAVVVKGHESGGRVGGWPAFMLVQAVAGRLTIPWYVRGAFGPETAAAAALAGATGAVLAEELWLARESPWDEDERALLARLDGSETTCVGDESAAVRLFRQAGREDLAAIEREIQGTLGGGAAGPAALLRRWSAADDAPSRLVFDRPFPMGQGIAFARGLAERHVNVAGILGAFVSAARELPEVAQRQRALAPDAPLAASHGTRFPIAQGPMTRVSDVAPFCRVVAEEGALPFLALALMRAPEVKRLLDATREALGDRPWGVGILGFVPPELRKEQLAIVAEARPRFALIAGGRPSQADELERSGIATYLHVPSPGLLTDFLSRGARRFVLEGQECGGHVGPRTSFTLWQSAVDVLSAADVTDPENVHVLFAGGIHDALSTAMVATVAAPLVERGMKVGVLMGTAYLFTPEAVAAGAITEEYQREALACTATALLESGVGHATRCAPTPFVDEFRARRRELLREERNADEVRLELEMLNVGRLRLASKGLVRTAPPPAARAGESLEERGRELASESGRGALVRVDSHVQQRDGMFMIGQVAALRTRVQPMRALHEDVSFGCVRVLDDSFARMAAAPAVVRREPAGEPLAIVGMACMFPDAPDLRTFWENVLRGHDAVRDVDEARWSPDVFFAPDRRAHDRAYSKRGAFLGETRFDPLRFRILPASVPHVEPAQLLALEVASRALKHAGYDRRPFARERTAVIFGSSGINDVGMAYAFRTMLRHYLAQSALLEPAQREAVIAEATARLPEWSEDSFAGILPNVIAGRVANRLDLLGSNYVIDAACSASMAALHAAAGQLRSRTCDVALVGAVDCSNNAFTYMGFSKTQALTSGERSRPFDDSADGIVLGEGVAALVLKRLADAERDGDDIHAVVRGIGSSSDGKSKSLTAPFAEGQVLAIRRALDDAGVDPSTIELVEAHATGTAAGDRAEIAALRQAFGADTDGATRRGPCAIGSVKSMIGHAKTAAGMAGLIKTALALRHRVLPPTINVAKPNPDLASGPFHLNTEARPWVHADDGAPRRASVSAFGFGGTNFHVVMEEHQGAAHASSRVDLAPRPGEVFTWRRASRDELARDLAALGDRLRAMPAARLDELAAGVFTEERRRPTSGGHGVRLAVLATSTDDLRAKLEAAASALAAGRTPADPRGVFFSDAAPATPSQVAFLFPGQGTLRPNALRDLAATGPFGAGAFEHADRLLLGLLGCPLSSVLMPPPTFDAESERRAKEALDDTRIAQPGVGVLDLFAHDVLVRFGLRPAVVGGHSYGEYVALCVAGTYDRDDLLRLSALRGAAVHEITRTSPGRMAAVAADEATTQRAIDELRLPLHVANMNAPRQTIIAGPREAIDSAVKLLTTKGLAARQIPVTAAFHTPAMREVSSRLAGHLERMAMSPPRLPVYGNVTAEPYPKDVAAIRAILTEHLARPVRFVDEVRAMHRDGARVFVEVGPGRVLTGLVRRILEDEPHAALAIDQPGEPSWLALGRLLVEAFALGLPVELTPWFEGRGLRTSSAAEAIDAARRRSEGRPTDWWVGPAGSRPVTPAPAVEAPRVSVPAAQVTAKPARIEAAPTPTTTSPSTAAAHALPSNGDARSTQRWTVARALPEVAMNDDRGGSTPERPAAPQAVVASDALARLQATMSEWLAMQRDRQRLDERFLGMQERLLVGLLGGPAPQALPDAAAAWNVGATHAFAPAPLASLPVAPAPVVPRLPAISEASASLPSISLPPPMATPAVAARTTAALPAAVASAAVGDAPSVDEFRRELLAEVSRRTGYPEEMLDLELPLEAGLGIDSIKVMEIFGALSRYHPFMGGEGQDEEELLLRFTQLKTLGAIVSHYAEQRDRPIGATVPAPAVAKSEPPALHAVAAVEAPRHVAALPVAANASAPSDADDAHAAAPSDPVDADASTPSDNDDFGAAMDAAPGAHDADASASADLDRIDDAAAPPSDAHVTVERLELTAVPAPLAGGFDLDEPILRLAPGQVLLVLGDVPPYGEALRAALAMQGLPAVQVIAGSQVRRITAGRYEVDLSDRASVAAFADLLSEEPGSSVAGIINLLNLDEAARRSELPDAELPLRLARSLLNVAHAFERDIRANAERGATLLVNVTALDGRFGLRGNRPLPIAQAPSIGFFKALAKEWPGVRVKTVDVDLSVDPAVIVASLLRELAATDDLVEVGLDAEGRWRLDLAEEGGGGGLVEPVELDRDSVVIATGGGRGITAAVLRHLARETGAHLVVVTRTEATLREDEPDDVRDLDDAQALRAAFTRRMRASDAATTPAQVEQELQHLLRQRELRDNLAAMREAGSQVEHHALDVRDTEKLGALVDDVQRRLGRVDGVIHGAGVVEDRRLRDKTPESFARVFRTKVDPALVFARKLRPETLKFLAFFSSVSARLGNAGQLDYAAANECLNKLADHLGRDWPGRVVAINWGPWDGGMMSERLRAAFAHRGIPLIPIELGARAFLAELGRNGHARAAEVVLACGTERLVEAGAGVAPA